MRFVHRYREGCAPHQGVNVANEPGLGFVILLVVWRLRVYFRFRWGHKHCRPAMFTRAGLMS